MRVKGPFMRHIPYSYKMMFSYLILILLTDVLVGYYSYNELVRSKTDAMENSMMAALKQAGANISYQMDEIQKIADSLYSNRLFGKAILAKGDPSDMYRVSFNQIIPTMETPLYFLNNKARIILYTINEDILDVNGEDLSHSMSKKFIYVLPYTRILESEWFITVKDNGDDNFWRQIGNDSEVGHLSYFRRLVSFQDYKSDSGYLRIVIRLDELFESLMPLTLNEGIMVNVKDRTGKALFSVGKSTARKNTDVLMIEERIENPRLTIETFIPRTILKNDAEHIRSVTFLVCLVSFLLMAGLGVIIARVSGRKMNKIISLVYSFQEGNLHKRLRLSGNDEFAHIANSFNAMAENINNLIQNVYEQAIQKKNAELEALQSQINPHFLYNTLSSINSLSKLKNNDQISEMVTGLAKFYRLTLNEGKSIISFEDELEQVKSYIDIQRVKYADRFTVQYDIQPDLMPCKVVKLILQPFVENALNHGWYQEHIKIWISGKKCDSLIVLEVSDNGIGIDEEAIQDLMNPDSKRSGYGIRNVNERIKLRYGSQYGITISSVPKMHTKVQIRLPIEIDVQEE